MVKVTSCGHFSRIKDCKNITIGQKTIGPWKSCLEMCVKTESTTER